LPRIQFPDADRLVSIRSVDGTTREAEPRVFHDFGIWREEAESVVDLAAGAGFDVNLLTDDGRVAAVRGGRVTDGFFRLPGVSPRLGRLLTSEDYLPGAAPVAVIGYDAWQRDFDGDPGTVGRTVRLGADPVTIVGVMPERFGFPYNHEVWVPLLVSAATQAPRQGPAVQVLGRLAPGVSMEQARAELETIGRRLAAELPAPPSWSRATSGIERGDVRSERHAARDPADQQQRPADQEGEGVR
jgi:hypothetical protein